MTDAVHEQLSACLDGELPAAELGLLLKRLARDGELREAAGRYTLIGEALRHGATPLASRDFTAKVMAAVVQESAIHGPSARISPVLIRRLRPFAGVGVAATVAALAIISVQRTSVQPEVVAVNATATDSAVALPRTQLDNPSYVVPPPTSSVAFVPATRLTNYVVAHSEYSSPLARRSVLTGVLAEDDGDSTIAPARDLAAPPQSR